MREMRFVVFSVFLVISFGNSFVTSARWSEWRDLTTCSAKPCGCNGNEAEKDHCPKGKKVEIRLCIREENDTSVCQWENDTGAIRLNDACENLNSCPGWSDWTPVGKCNCEGNSQVIKRACDNPAPVYPDLLCINEFTGEQVRVQCNTRECNCTEGQDVNEDFAHICQVWTSWKPIEDCNCETNKQKVGRVCDQLDKYAQQCLDEYGDKTFIEQTDFDYCECEEETTSTTPSTTPLPCCKPDEYGSYGSYEDDIKSNEDSKVSPLDKDYYHYYDSLFKEKNKEPDCRPCEEPKNSTGSDDSGDRHRDCGFNAEDYNADYDGENYDCGGGGGDYDGNDDGDDDDDDGVLG